MSVSQLQILSEFSSSIAATFKTYPILSLLLSILYFIFSYTFGVHIKEWVKERRKKSIEKKEKLKLLANANKLRKNQSGKAFSFGKVSTSVYVLDYNQQGYSKNFLISELVDDNEKIPDEYQEQFNDKLKFWQLKKDNGEIFEGAKKVSVKKVQINESPIGEEKRFRIGLDNSKGYVHQRAATSVFLDLDCNLRNNIISEPHSTMEPFFSNSFGILIGIITGDDQLVFIKRGSSTAVNENKIICGAVEGMIDKDIINGKLNPIVAASRALSEEFGINLDNEELSSIKIVSCIFNCDYHEWNLVGYVDLRKFGNKYLSSVLYDYNSTAKARDSWEVNELMFLDFKPRIIAGYLLSHESEVVNYSKVTAIFTLLSAYENRAEIAKAFDADINLTI
ncbi:hypothetical protein [Pseudoalteromonas xiamenensis]